MIKNASTLSTFFNRPSESNAQKKQSNAASVSRLKALRSAPTKTGPPSFALCGGVSYDKSQENCCGGNLTESF